jgi:hypothetical protein
MAAIAISVGLRDLAVRYTGGPDVRPAEPTRTGPDLAIEARLVARSYHRNYPGTASCPGAKTPFR